MNDETPTTVPGDGEPDSEPLGIHKLIASIPEDQIQVQNVLHNATDFKNGKKQATITFTAPPEHVADLIGTAMGATAKTIGLVLWFPASALAARKETK